MLIASNSSGSVTSAPATLTLIAPPVSTNTVVGPVFSEINGHYYWLLQQTNWTTSETWARELGGHLATVRDAPENGWILSTFGNASRYLWIGLNDQASEGTYVWASGEANSFRNWLSGQPDNGAGGGTEDFVQLYSGQQWNDFINASVLGTTPMHGVVEVVPGPPAFTTQPTNSFAYERESLTLTGNTIGAPAPVYQWFFGGTPITGANNLTLSLTNLQLSQQGSYYVTASNQFGMTLSSSAVLTVGAVLFPTQVEDFELGLSGWRTDNPAVWQVGQPTKAGGPAVNAFGSQAHGGTNCAATVLGGNYPAELDTRLVSPAFVVPPLGQNPRLRFWHWFRTWSTSDKGWVEIKPVGTNIWTTISPDYFLTAC